MLSNYCFPTNGFSLIAIGRDNYVLHQPDFVDGLEKFVYQALYTLAEGKVDLFEKSTIQYLTQNLHNGEQLCQELTDTDSLHSLALAEFLLSALDSVRYYQKLSSISTDYWPRLSRIPLHVPLLVNSRLDYVKRGWHTSYRTTVFFFNKDSMQRVKQKRRVKWHSYTMKRGALLFCLDMVNILRRNITQFSPAKASNIYQDGFLKNLIYLVDITNPQIKRLSKRHKTALLELYDVGIDLIEYYRKRDDGIASFISLEYRL